MGRSDLISRSVALCVAVLLHAVVLSGFLAKWQLGLSVERHPDAHPSETLTPMVASIISFGSEDPRAKASRTAPMDANGLSAAPARLDIPTSIPSWSAEEEPVPVTAQPTPSAGRTGLYCEIHAAVAAAALALYYIISEGSRVVFPARNLIPVW